jgi:hypothetical protein
MTNTVRRRRRGVRRRSPSVARRRTDPRREAVDRPWAAVGQRAARDDSEEPKSETAA